MKTNTKIVTKQDIITSLVYVKEVVIRDSMPIIVAGRKGNFGQLMSDTIAIVKKDVPDDICIESTQIDNRKPKLAQNQNDTIHLAQIDREQVAGVLTYVTDVMIQTLKRDIADNTITEEEADHLSNLVGSLLSTKEIAWQAMDNKPFTIGF
ncbi:hypothetical protein DS831_05970 [Bombilactobacillus bombi]|uniref:Uncharacterized protein n=1 Tax=Bombilactobacillus bombi TaxID=1303590 RepID=A0A417ZEL8_9LACO|nr:hypothetical protein [Bombilactobacillus bombi]RHW49708.1 hypothetical protein DS831_05970 [Bombilactobacillus bombi]